MPNEELSTYVDKSMYPSEPMPQEGGCLPRVTLLSATPDPLGALGAACAMYEGRVIRDIARDLTDDDRWRYWEEVQKTHLKAPLEFIDLHFMVENVTRALTHQMVRQRTAVYAQESLRFAVKEEIAARPGPLVSENKDSLKQWEFAVQHIWDAYRSLIANGIPAEEARGLLPHDTLTRLNYKTNLRNLAEHLGNRLCTQAQFEWRYVGAEIKQAIGNYHHSSAFGGQLEVTDDQSWQWELIANSNIFLPICFNVGHCPFGAEFDRGCTIRERVNKGDFKSIKIEEWALDPKAAWQ